MEYVIDTTKVNRSLFAQRIVDVHNDEFGFAQNGMMYTYAVDSKSNAKGVAWLRMQSTGERGRNRKKYLLYFGDETEHSAYVDKHNDIYDLDGNYIASLVRSKFLVLLFLFIAFIILLTGLSVWLGGSFIMNTTSPYSEKNTIELDDPVNQDDDWTTEKEIDIIDDPVTEFEDEGDKVIYPGYESVYKVRIRNTTDMSLYYSLKITETNDYSIPIKYRLLLDGEYVIGDKNTWVTIDELATSPVRIKSGKKADYAIEWYWDPDVDDEYDTQLGMEAVAEYILNVEVIYEEAY